MFCIASEYPASLNIFIFYHYVVMPLCGTKCSLFIAHWVQKSMHHYWDRMERICVKIRKRKIRNVRNIIYVNKIAILCLDKSHMSHWGHLLIVVVAAGAESQAEAPPLELLEGFSCTSPISPLWKGFPLPANCKLPVQFIAVLFSKALIFFKNIDLKENVGEKPYLCCEPRDSPCYCILSDL